MSRLFGIHKAAADLSSRLEASTLAAFDANSIESPIERLLYISFITYCDNFLLDHHLNGLSTLGKDEVPDFGEISISQQVRVLDWPVDFVVKIGLGDGRAGLLAVECDGHDFHERTKEQAARDRRRDRSLQASGYTVMRFTGSELYADPVRCVIEIINWAVAQINARLRDQP